MNIGNQCIFTNVNDQKVRGNLPVSHIRYSGVLIENWLPNLCVLKKNLAMNFSLGRNPWTRFYITRGKNEVFRWGVFKQIWNCGLFTIIMDILHGVFLCVLGMLGDLVIIWYMIRNDLYLKMKIVLSRKLVLWNCKYGCEWIYHLFIITNSSNNNNNNRLRVFPTANVTKKILSYFQIKQPIIT